MVSGDNRTYHQYDNNSFILPKEVLRIIEGVPDFSKHPERDSLIIEIGWETGGRITEVLNLKPKNVMEDSIAMITEKQKLKPGKKQPRIWPPIRFVYASPDLCNWIRKYCDQENIGPEDWIFPSIHDKKKILGRGQIHKMITEASEHAKVFRLGKANPRTGGRYKGISYHVLRHSYAVYMLRKTNSVKTVQKQLGHASINSTNAYADIAYDDVRVNVAKAGIHLYHPS